jgi:hypothetical protein
MRTGLRMLTIRTTRGLINWRMLVRQAIGTASLLIEKVIR